MARLVAGLLFGLNFYLCRELFYTAFFDNLQSNEGAWMALARYYRDHPGAAWFPMWNAGLPMENTYSPLIPVLGALLSAMGLSPATAVHAIAGFFYCFGPALWFWLAWKWSGNMPCAFAAGLLYSLVSPSAILFHDLSTDLALRTDPRRLVNVVVYGEIAHLVALSLLPIALFSIERALRMGRSRDFVLAIGGSALVALANAFGLAVLALGVLVVFASFEMPAVRRAILRIGLIGGATYLLICPFLTPTLMATVARNSVRENTAAGIRSIGGWMAVLAGAALVRWFARNRPFFDRFAFLFAWIFLSLLAINFGLGIGLLPYVQRYHIEADVGLCLAAAAVLMRMPGHLQWAVTLAVLLLAIPQTIRFRQIAHEMMRPTEIEKSIEYKVSRWIDENLPGARTMVSGHTAYLFNVFSNNPQLSGGHDLFAPNLMQLVAVYTIYSGANAGPRDAEYSVFWLKAFGAHAIYVPGPRSREHYHPFANPRKFEGVLPVLWREEDDTIYSVPIASKSLARVVRASSIVTRRPAHGLDIEPGAAYVRDLDDSALPKATFKWLSPTRARIRTTLAPEQRISVQMNYDPGWIAYSGNQRHAVTSDALGLIVISPVCAGECDLILEFDGGWERKLARAVSIATAVLLLWWTMRASRAPAI